MSSKHEIVILTLALIVSIMTAVTQCQELMTPLNINITMVNGGDSGQCPSNEMRERGFNETDQQVRSLLSEYLASKQLDEEQTTVLPPTTASTTEQSVSTTTDPLEEPCGGPGWRQVVFINMTDTSYNCPPGLSLTSYSKRTCGRSNGNSFSCSLTTFSVGGSEYSRVCGRIIGYQVGATCAFWGQSTTNQMYADGVTLTYGQHHQHIWTFVAGLNENVNGQHPHHQCPCDTSSSLAIPPPEFVGNDYFCESGLHSTWNCGSYCGVIFPDDPLWDGQNCISTSTCCQLNSPPWFIKNLPNSTTDDIDLRMCLSSSSDYNDSPLELIELYVQ